MRISDAEKPMQSACHVKLFIELACLVCNNFMDSVGETLALHTLSAFLISLSPASP